MSSRFEAKLREMEARPDLGMSQIVMGFVEPQFVGKEIIGDIHCRLTKRITRQEYTGHIARNKMEEHSLQGTASFEFEALANIKVDEKVAANPPPKFRYFYRAEAIR